MTSRASISPDSSEKTHGVSSFPEAANNGCVRPDLFPRCCGRRAIRTGFIGKFGLGGELAGPEFDYFKGFPGQGKYVNL